MPRIPGHETHDLPREKSDWTTSVVTNMSLSEEQSKCELDHCPQSARRTVKFCMREVCLMLMHRTSAGPPGGTGEGQTAMGSLLGGTGFRHPSQILPITVLAVEDPQRVIVDLCCPLNTPEARRYCGAD